MPDNYPEYAMYQGIKVKVLWVKGNTAAITWEGKNSMGGGIVGTDELSAIIPATTNNEPINEG